MTDSHTGILSPQSALQSLEELRFDNRFTQLLPADTNTENSRRQVTAACYSRAQPLKVVKPTLVALSNEVAELLGLDPIAVNDQDWAEVFSGNRRLAGMDPFAMCYGGHQFGNWAGQLGDGRAINLGEVLTDAGAHLTLQLKGAGPTPYSRGADGLAVLRSSLREFLCSEAMYHLGVPTTRALSLVLTGEQVVRDMFYDGRPQIEAGAVVCRVAPSFVRFGNFEIFASRGDTTTLQRLVDYTLERDFPHLGPPNQAAYAALFEEVCRTTAEMIVHWMRVGFVHGVMNTDNMSILGLTIDYGPYGWLENYDPQWTPNTTDADMGRYCFGNQPQIAQWNLLQLAKALAPVMQDHAALQLGLESYAAHFESGWQSMMAGKLGLAAWQPDTDADLVDELYAIFATAETDMTLFFRQLASVGGDIDKVTDALLLEPLSEAYYVPEQQTVELRVRTAVWVRRYLRRARSDGTPDADRKQRMLAVNPKFVLRNYLAQLAIDKVDQGDFSLVHELLQVLRNPYNEQLEQQQFAAKRPDWARNRPGCSMLSCSS